MKKYYTSFRFIKFNVRHSWRQLKSKKKFLAYLSNKHRNNSEKVHKTDSYDRFFSRKYNIAAPINFSLVENTEETIKFLNKIDARYNEKTPVFIDLKNVENIGDEVIVVLLAKVIRFKNRKIKFNGNYPKKRDVTKTLIESKFFDVLFNTQDATKVNKGISGNGIYTHADNSVNSELGSELINLASQRIWGNIRSCTGVQGTIIELMTNTNNHAGNTTGEKRWWMSMNCLVDKSVVKFSFVDFGKGIFSSLGETTNSWFPWYKIFSVNKNNADILKQILMGKMHETSTNESHRGKGLPGIFENMQMNYLSNLYIISNNVFADVQNEKYVNLDVGFNGTFVWWELNQDNKSFALE